MQGLFVQREGEHEEEEEPVQGLFVQREGAEEEERPAGLTAADFGPRDRPSSLRRLPSTASDGGISVIAHALEPALPDRAAETALRRVRGDVPAGARSARLH